MAYFPMLIDMTNLKVLVVGGGAIATEKLEKLIDFTTNITIISIKVEERAKELIEKYGLTLEKRAYIRGDIDGFDIVIVATDTIELHKAIYEESRDSKTLINSVDDTQYCDFIFPSYIKRDDLTIAFSTGGASPAFAKELRQYIEKIIPQNVGEFLKEMKALRKSMPKGKERMEYFERVVKEYFLSEFKKQPNS